jgi:hypothetical protein
VTVKLAAVPVDCEDALTVGRFWSAALGRPLDPNPSSGFAAIGMTEHRDVQGWRLGGDPTWLFAGVPERKSAKNRMHVEATSSAWRKPDESSDHGLGPSRERAWRTRRRRRSATAGTTPRLKPRKSPMISRP